MKKILGSLVLGVTGWKMDYDEKFMINKGVLVAAPHTSNWDFFFTMAVFWKRGTNIKFLIKDSYTKSLFGFFFRWMGAVGVDRENGKNMVNFAASLLKEKDLIFTVPAEGKRKRVEKWKTGFYHIAKTASVPILLGFLDYEKKIGGVKKMIVPSDSFEKDMQEIQDYYKDFKGKFPEFYNPSIY